mmetsp:Transcript_22908/g.22092  ORF Transcript_22908/g.22092 Transcript_22908/m.22092 type:complete len:189 (-) Transcript_22908:32-598(-)
MGIFHSAVELDSNILVLGIDFSGKTTIVKRMMTMQFNPVDDKDTTKNMNVYMDEVTLNIPTQGSIVKLCNTSGFPLVFRDCGGLKHLRQGWRRYYSTANLLIYVIDCSNRCRMEETGNEILQILDEKKLAGKPILILANKCDLINSLTSDQLLAALNLHSIRDRPWKIILCSGMRGDGLQVWAHMLDV